MKDKYITFIEYVGTGIIAVALFLGVVHGVCEVLRYEGTANEKNALNILEIRKQQVVKSVEIERLKVDTQIKNNLCKEY